MKQTLSCLRSASLNTFQALIINLCIQGLKRFSIPPTSSQSIWKGSEGELNRPDEELHPNPMYIYLEVIALSVLYADTQS